VKVRLNNVDATPARPELNIPMRDRALASQIRSAME